jgi:hypothetical protein
MSARSLDAYLNAPGGLARLSAHAGRLVKLQRVFERVAPSYLAASSRVANFKSGVVVIHADSGAVAAKLRQMLPSLVDEFSSKGAEITEIQVKVQPSNIAPQQIRGRLAPKVSAHAKAALTRLEADLPEDSPLKEPLGRLVKRSRE